MALMTIIVLEVGLPLLCEDRGASAGDVVRDVSSEEQKVREVEIMSTLLHVGQLLWPSFGALLAQAQSAT